ncbi:hypothetical protein B0H14DRAFT_2758283 [Mycena olivaceomarginata]|nr:hypothetical protein B0H14DRAFT_2758283 [Mycena olivaceomarginata]
MTTRTAQAGGAPHGGDAGCCGEERMRAGQAGTVVKEEGEHVENTPHMRVLGPGDGGGADDGADDDVPPICSMEMEEDGVDEEEDAVDPEAMAVDSRPFLGATSSPTPVPEDVDQLDEADEDEGHEGGEGVDRDGVVWEHFDVRAPTPSKRREYYKKAVESTAVRTVPTQTNKRPRPSESPLECDVCGKTFGRPSDTKRHIRTVHLKGADQWTCPGCAKEESFSRKDALLRHIHLVHTEDRDRLRTMVRRRAARVPETGGRGQRPEEEHRMRPRMPEADREQRPGEEHRMRPRMPEADREQRPEEEDSTLEADCGEQRQPVQENPVVEAERLQDGFSDMVLDCSGVMLVDTGPPASALVPEGVDELEDRTIKQEDLEQPPRVTDSEDDSSHDEADNESSYGEENSDVPASVSKGVGREILVDYNTRVASKRPAALDARSSTPLKRREHFESSSTPSEEYYQEAVESSGNKKAPVSGNQCLESHTNRYQSGPRFKCRVAGCEKTLSRRADRERHELTHRGANKWTCPGCSRVLARTDSLMRHIEGVHSVEERDRLKEAVERAK